MESDGVLERCLRRAVWCRLGFPLLIKSDRYRYKASTSAIA
ncbi:hypothetical protein [Nostoc sp. KVJ3]|nr:hypothetical protein [Nostoc sp. KVJ3]